MKNILIGQSGGPTAVINSSLAGVIDAGLRSEKIDKIYGMVGGIEGLLNKDLTELSDKMGENELRLLKQTPSSFLMSCRKKLKDYKDDEETYVKIFDILKEYNISHFFYIGGNDSMDTVDKLSRYASETGSAITFSGVPKTIDNDLPLTDHTPGYGSAAKFVANTVRALAQDTTVYKMPSVIILEIMGRNAGWLTAAASLGNSENVLGTDIICLPERPFDAEKFLSKVERNIASGKFPIISISEGIKDKNGKYISEGVSLKGEADGFAHANLGGVGRVIEKLISDNLKIKTRTIELSTLQRCFSPMASMCDVEEAFLAGSSAARFSFDGQSAFMPCFNRVSDNPYKIEISANPVSQIANLERTVPDNMISADGMGITSEFISYARPLILGEPNLVYKDGVLEFLVR